ncbi:hypothetical protein OGR47_08890 [Methylocystis sp. MJC1]|jgi:hypothetical protein|uniref:hypothetical protein n=1 Tax=Methylocystis sp. MJC1 TaxID=2654282 RepID=UPI0013ECD3AA|nr:hypothetical protein [Methylocystis sp. MJC1]KAF2991660.1 hypothetical protein MJC1_01225 [Methylocystis sp. MJC1]MBU6527102.1 hypothetical protein [Methylocystis sp. MJC1]UZX13537.1 hypothetical protein OGR47_08890 [Methylocystis sp. MJC1]
MRPCARPFSGSLLVAAFVIGAGAAVAQELQLDPKAFDPKALDTSGASSVQTKRSKGRKGADSNAQQTPGKPQATPNGPNRQFGELEGWSPGKAPPKPKDKEDRAPSGPKAPVSVSPSGNMGTGFAF